MFKLSKTAATQADVPPASYSISITQNANGNWIATPKTLEIVTGFSGPIMWTIVAPNSAVQVAFQSIDFTSEPEGAGTPTLNGSSATMPWVDNNSTTQPQDYNYTCTILVDGTPVLVDPTVANDGPGGEQIEPRLTARHAEAS
jgi:hypothetical protein